MNAEDLIRIRHAAQSTHERTKLVLAGEHEQQEYEVQRDDCIEKRNAVLTVLAGCENDKDELRRAKRQIDDQIAEVSKLEREFKGYKEDLDLDAKRCNNEYWERRKGRKMQDNYPKSV